MRADLQPRPSAPHQPDSGAHRSRSVDRSSQSQGDQCLRIVPPEARPVRSTARKLTGNPRVVGSARRLDPPNLARRSRISQAGMAGSSEEITEWPRFNRHEWLGVLPPAARAPPPLPFPGSNQNGFQLQSQSQFPRPVAIKAKNGLEALPVRPGDDQAAATSGSEPVAARSGTGSSGRLPSSQAWPWKRSSRAPIPDQCWRSGWRPLVQDHQGSLLG